MKKELAKMEKQIDSSMERPECNDMFGKDIVANSAQIKQVHDRKR